MLVFIVRTVWVFSCSIFFQNTSAVSSPDRSWTWKADFKWKKMCEWLKRGGIHSKTSCSYTSTHARLYEWMYVREYTYVRKSEHAEFHLMTAHLTPACCNYACFLRCKPSAKLWFRLELLAFFWNFACRMEQFQILHSPTRSMGAGECECRHPCGALVLLIRRHPRERYITLTHGCWMVGLVSLLER